MPGKHKAGLTGCETVMSDPGNIAEFDGLRTWFFTGEGTAKAVDGVSFAVPKHAAVGIVGESGCGKSVTALSLMRLLQRPQGRIVGGEIRFNLGGGRAVDLVRAPESELIKLRGNRASMIFQEPMTALNPVFKCGAQIGETIRAHDPGASRADAKARALRLLGEVGLAGGAYDRYPHELSGGMRQRVVIAMALACAPDLIIADEPTTALDVTVEAQILGLLKDLKNRTGCSVLLITHDLDVIASMADRIVVMYAGRVVERGTAEEIFRSPRHPYTIGLLKSRPVSAGKAGALFSIPGRVPDPARLPGCCYFRDRCGEASEACAGPYPPETQITPTHAVSCLRCGQGEGAAGSPRTEEG